MPLPRAGRADGSAGRGRRGRGRARSGRRRAAPAPALGARVRDAGLRPDPDSGRRRHGGREPPPAALRRRRVARRRAWLAALRGDDRARELGPIALPLAAFVALDRARASLDGRPAPGRDLPRRLRAPLRPAGDRLRAPALEPACAAGPLRGAGRHRAGVCGRRPLPVGHARGLLEPEAAGRQRVRALLPRQLRLLGSVDLRPLSRRRDPGDARARPARAARAAARRGNRRDRRHVGRACSSRSRSRASRRCSPAPSPPRRSSGAGAPPRRSRSLAVVARRGRVRDAAGANEAPATSPAPA